MTVLEKILAAREERARLKETFAAGGRASICLSLNVPGYPKSEPLTSRGFRLLLEDFKNFLTAHRIPWEKKQAHYRQDEAGDFFIAPLRHGLDQLEQLKHQCESFEENHPLGRLVDVDLAGEDGNPISSGKSKSCFICPDRPAVSCMRDETHSMRELREYVSRRIRSYMGNRRREQVCRELSTLALKSVLFEISLSPKPGAVGPLSSGSHKDMDYYTFLGSTAVISGWFSTLARSGFDFDGPPEAVLPEIRSIGLEMEQFMFRETGGVNTQKGLIFLMGNVLFASARVLRQQETLDVTAVTALIREWAGGLTQREMEHAGGQNKPTHGETCFQKYGAPLGGGIRYEVENGLPTVMSHGLPKLREALRGKPLPPRREDIETALTRAMLALMAENNDSNILYRSGPQCLEQVKHRCREILDTRDPDQWREKYDRLVEFCREQHISPGGSMDLLSITLFLYFAETAFNGKEE